MTNLPTILFEKRHLNKFRECYPKALSLTSSTRAGKSGLAWFKGGPNLGLQLNLSRFDKPLCRSELFELRDDRTVGELELCIAILAWGEMRISNRNRLFSNDVQPWIAVAKRVRAGDLDREAAYAEFAKLHQNKELPGMGPAYFTKLIYFLMPRQRDLKIGYIMDQWLGCSINLLCGSKVVLMDHAITWSLQNGVIEPGITSRTSPMNSSKNYVRFCEALESLALELGAGWTADTVELALMSEGWGRGHWRRYVIEQRRGQLGV